MITIDVHTPRSELALEVEDDDSSDEEEMFDMVSALVSISKAYYCLVIICRKFLLYPSSLILN